MTPRPEIADAPGLTWKPRKAGWEARWQADTAVARLGYTLKSVALWKGFEPTAEQREFIAVRCRELQQWMQDWKATRVVKSATFDGTLHSLIDCYTTDRVSTYQKLRHKTRENYDSLLKRLVKDHGPVRVADVTFRVLKEWELDWAASGHIAMTHSLFGMLRTLISFGATILDNEPCLKVALLLSKMRVQMSEKPTERMLLEQVVKLIAKAHEIGLHSIALAEAIKCDTGMRQKDVIGERVPIGDKNFPPTDVILGNEKWGRGARWDEIDADLVFNHVQSKKQKADAIPLSETPLVMAEFARIGVLPDTGPMIICEETGEPWKAHEYRRQFRIIARLCGIPDHIKSMHTRSGFISEGTEAGADIEMLRQAVKHSNSATTQRYSRADIENTATVLRLKKAHRANKAGKSD